jgi:hypothetical protein
MSAITEAKELSQLIHKLGNIDLERKVVALHGEVVELADKNRELQNRVRELEDQAKVRASMTYKAPFWFAKGDDVPFCPRCWEKEECAMHLIPANDLYYRCLECDEALPKSGVLVPDDDEFA